MEKNKPKVIETSYYILINDEVLSSFESLAGARKEIKNLNIGEEVREVKIVKQTTSHTLVDSYKPKVTKTLSVEELNWD
jgi:hypothetical protein